MQTLQGIEHYLFLVLGLLGHFLNSTASFSVSLTKSRWLWNGHLLVTTPKVLPFSSFNRLILWAMTTLNKDVFFLALNSPPLIQLPLIDWNTDLILGFKWAFPCLQLLLFISIRQHLTKILTCTLTLKLLPCLYRQSKKMFRVGVKHLIV